MQCRYCFRRNPPSGSNRPRVQCGRADCFRAMKREHKYNHRNGHSRPLLTGS